MSTALDNMRGNWGFPTSVRFGVGRIVAEARVVAKMAVMDQEKCQKCGECFKACRRDAILMPRLTVVAENCEH